MGQKAYFCIANQARDHYKYIVKQAFEMCGRSHWGKLIAQATKQRFYALKDTRTRSSLFNHSIYFCMSICAH